MCIILFSWISAGKAAAASKAENGLEAAESAEAVKQQGTDVIRESVTIRNTGTGNAENIHTECSVPDGYRSKDGNTSFYRSFLAPGQNITYQVSFIPDTSGTAQQETVQSAPVRPQNTSGTAAPQQTLFSRSSTEMIIIMAFFSFVLIFGVMLAVALSLNSSKAKRPGSRTRRRLQPQQPSLQNGGKQIKKNKESGRRKQNTVKKNFLLLLFGTALLVSLMQEHRTYAADAAGTGASAESGEPAVSADPAGGGDPAEHVIALEETADTGGKKAVLPVSIRFRTDDAVSGGKTLGELSADPCDIRLNQTASVTFFLKTAQGTAVSAPVLYDEAGQKLAVMQDDGTHGDVKASDGIFTAQAQVSSGEIGTVAYHAAEKNQWSDDFNICFYRDLTKEEFKNFTDLAAGFAALTYEDAKNAVAASGQVTSYSEDDVHRTIKYSTAEHMQGIWADFSDSSRKGTGEAALTKEQGADYTEAEKRLSALTRKPLHDKKDVAVIRPFHGTAFKYDDFRLAGECLSQALGSNLKVMDDSEASLDQMKSLGTYGTVLIDGHGTVADGNPYILTGQSLDSGRFLWDPVYYLQHVQYTADYISGRICIAASRAAVGGDFFKKYYTDGSLKDSFWFLGSCFSMYGDSISDALLSRGAAAAAGYDNTVSTRYCNKTLFEMLINSMTLSADTAKGGQTEAQRLYGAKEGDTAMRLAGDRDFRLFKAEETSHGTLSGKICKASDHTTPVPSAAIQLSRNQSTDQTAVSDADGKYSVKLPEGKYYVSISAPGFVTFHSYAEVKKDLDTYMETFLMVEGNENQQGSVSGRILNALTGDGIPGAALSVRRDWNNPDQGDVLQTASSDGNGAYSFSGLPLGNYTVAISKDGYISNTLNVTVQAADAGGQDGTLTPVLNGTDYRIVLTWGENPEDLDSHMVEKTDAGTGFHVWYPQLDGSSQTGVKVCNLDLDDTTSYGPETVTLSADPAGTYHYFVYKFKGSGTLASSEAQVKVYQGGTIIGTFNVPTDQGSGDYWNVFTIRNGVLNQENTITETSVDGVDTVW